MRKVQFFLKIEAQNIASDWTEHLVASVVTFSGPASCFLQSINTFAHKPPRLLCQCLLPLFISTVAWMNVNPLFNYEDIFKLKFNRSGLQEKTKTRPLSLHCLVVPLPPGPPPLSAIATRKKHTGILCTSASSLYLDSRHVQAIVMCSHVYMCARRASQGRKAVKHSRAQTCLCLFGSQNEAGHKKGMILQDVSLDMFQEHTDETLAQIKNTC